MLHTLLRLSVAAALALAALPAQPTYSKEVARIMQSKCQGCHRPGDIAPFSLQNFEEVSPYVEDIRRVVDSRRMPPWKPVAGYGDFAAVRALSDEERKTILDWIDAGAPEGDRGELPEAPPPTRDWPLGDPDLVLQMPEAYSPPLGKDMYRCFVIPTGLEENRFVSAIDVLPGVRSSVHHVILYLDTTGDAERLDREEEGPGYTCYGGPGTSIVPSASNLSLGSLLSIGATLGGWAPGQRPQFLPKGIGMYLDARAKIVMQVHYYSTRRVGEDQTRLGLYFNREPVERRLLWLPVLPLDERGRLSMQIPAGEKDVEIKASFTTPPLPLFDVSLIAIYPHMHLLGRKIALELQRRGEDPEPLIRIDDWNFNWQGSYTYSKPVKAPAGSTVRLACTYDNTIDNPYNPAKEPRLVTWGEGTEDEMCLAFLGITFDRENLLPFTGRRVR